MPVYSSHLGDQVLVSVAQRIREERQRRGYTLRQLAADIGVSAAQLSNIETGKRVPELAHVAAIAQAVSVPVGGLVPPIREYPYFTWRREFQETAKPFTRELVGPEPGPSRHHNLVWLLAEPFVGKYIEPVMAEILPLPDADLHFIGHDHEEFMFVLQGEVESLVKTNDGLVKERLKAGDSLYFRSYLPHCHRSATVEPARTLNVMYSLRGPFDSYDGEFGAAGHQFYRRGVYADVGKEAAEKIGLLRRSRGFSVSHLASVLGIGVRQLTQIEQGKKSPDLALLLRLARTFRRPIEYFFATTLERQPYYFVHRGEQINGLRSRHRRTPRHASGSRSVYWPLAAGFVGRGMYPYYLQLKPSAEDVLPMQEHHGQEFIYVLDGEVELVTFAADEEVAQILNPGDAVFLESSVPHLLRGRSPQNPYAQMSAEMIAVFWTPLGEEYLFTDAIKRADPPDALTAHPLDPNSPRPKPAASRRKSR